MRGLTPDAAGRRLACFVRPHRTTIVDAAKLPKVRSPQQREGDVFVIPLGNLGLAFGRICAGLDHAYYELLATVAPPLDDIVKRPIIFRVPVARDAIAAGG
jgi:hypothetical protein